MKATPIKCLKPALLSFTVIPREVKKNHGRTKVKLAAVLQPIFGLDGAEIVATIKGRRKRFRYSRQLESFIRDNDLAKVHFKPLEKYLVKQINEGKKNPLPLISDLKIFLEEGNLPSFNVQIGQ